MWLHCKGKDSIRVSNEESGDILESGEYGLKRDFVPNEELVDLNDLSDSILRSLGKEAKIAGYHNMKRENLINKLKDTK